MSLVAAGRAAGPARNPASRRSCRSTLTGFEGSDEAIISLYAKGLTTRAIQAHRAEIYDVDVSRDLISRVADKVTDKFTLRVVYTAPTVEAAETRLAEFEHDWGERYPMIVKLWRQAWEQFTP